jgi:pimeloyl-ACP methyl ester carboxylesterase
VDPIGCRPGGDSYADGTHFVAGETAVTPLHENGPMTGRVHLHVDVAGRGPALLVTHGFSATSAMWAGQVDGLAVDHTVIRWDMRGHGESDYPDDPAAYSLELTVQDMVDVLDGAGVSRATLVGHSLGGFASLAFTRVHPERVAGLVLVDTGPGFRRAEAREAWNAYAEATAEGLEARGLDALGPSDEVRAATHRSAAGLALSARGVLVQRDAAVIDALPAVDVATLVIVGSEDRAFRSGSDYMAAKIPGSELVVIDGAGHAPNLSHPERFEAALRGFLDRSGL